MLRLMAKTVKNAGPKRSLTKFNRTVIYRGIKIPPIKGRRSPTAQAIRDALRTKSEHPRGGPSHG
jgi:hypothetical protein